MQNKQYISLATLMNASELMDRTMRLLMGRELSSRVENTEGNDSFIYEKAAAKINQNLAVYTKTGV